MKKIRTFLAAALICAVTASISTAYVAEDSDAAVNTRQDSFQAQGETPVYARDAAVITEKNEIVYARLTGAGAARDVFTVNRFTVEQGGLIADYGDYASVMNLTNLEPLAHSGDTVTVGADTGVFYYQGSPKENSLPWLYNITYFMDGAAVLPEELAGRSGALEIRLVSEKNPGSDTSFADNYMQQITVTLNLNKCRNIKAPGATAADAGHNGMFNYTVLPGGGADITVTADVTDFEMPGIEIAAMPFSMDFNIPETDGLTDGFEQLSDGITALNDGARQLKDGAAELADGAGALASGSVDFAGGLESLNGGAADLTGASSEIESALKQIAAGLTGAQIPDTSGIVEDFAALPTALSELADGMTQISGGMTQLKNGFSQGYAALDAAIEGIPSHQIDELQLYALMTKADDKERALLTDLMESYTAAMIVKGTYEQTKAAFESVEPTLDMLSASADTIAAALDEISEQLAGALSQAGGGTGAETGDITQQIAALTGGITALSDNYTAFHSGLAAFMRGINEAADGYNALDSGFAELADGIAQLSGGVSELYGGISQIADETADIPDRIQNEINSLISGLTAEEREPVSFMSEKNENIGFVQFVFITEPIEKPAPPKTEHSAANNATIWTRFLDLFTDR